MGLGQLILIYYGIFVNENVISFSPYINVSFANVKT